MRGVAQVEAATRIGRILEKMRISELGSQYPGQLSGGQQQRVALARALVYEADLVLFDEPLSNVDAKVRERLRLEIKSLQTELGFTALYVTHDQEEAMSLATRIAVVADGSIAQLGTPQEVYLKPRSLQVARFVGSANELHGELKNLNSSRCISTVLGDVILSPSQIPDRSTDVMLVSRPENWRVTTNPVEEACIWEGTILAAAFLGAANEYLVDLGPVKIQVRQASSALLPVGSRVWCSVSPDAFMVLTED